MRVLVYNGTRYGLFFTRGDSLIYGYARCSTDDIKQDIDRQIEELRANGAEMVFSEYESGTLSNRPQLKKLLRRMKEGDTLMTCEVSRLTRDVRKMCDIIDTAKRKRLVLIFGGYRVDCSGVIDPMQEGMCKMAAVFAEIERNLIVQRVKSGMANAKAKGAKFGRPRLDADTVPKSAKVYIRRYMAGNGTMTKSECAKACGISRPTLDRYIRILSGV